jgi:hypothetical protein
MASLAVLHMAFGYASQTSTKAEWRNVNVRDGLTNDAVWVPTSAELRALYSRLGDDVWYRVTGFLANT